MQRQGLGGRGCVTNKQKKYKNAAKSKYTFSLHPTAEARGALSRRGNYFWREREGSAQPSPAAGGEAQKRAARPYPGADLRPRGRAGGRAVRTVQPSPPPVPSAPRPFSPRGRHSPPAVARRQRAGAPSSPLFSSLSPPHPRGEGEPWSHSRPARSCRLFRRCRAAAITRAETRPPNRHPPSQRGNAGAAG